MKYRNFLFALAFSPLMFTVSIYDFTVTAGDGSPIHFSDFKGKKILIVNIASRSKYAGQLQGLSQLKTRLKDSLVIIALPSNSFGNEPGSDVQIADSLSKATTVNFLVAAKTQVSGVNMHPLYSWLTDQSQNGTMANPVRGDFQKFLVNADGVLVCVFTGAVDPLSNEMLNGIKMN